MLELRSLGMRLTRLDEFQNVQYFIQDEIIVGDIIAKFPEETIKSYQFKKRLFIGYKLRIFLNDGRELDFNVNKILIGAGWHKTELQSILETNYYNKNIK